MGLDLAEPFVRVAEDSLGAMLPDTYHAAMMLNNGGTVEALNEAWQLFQSGIPRTGSD